MGPAKQPKLFEPPQQHWRERERQKKTKQNILTPKRMKNKIKIKDGRSRRPLNFKKEEEFGFKEKKKVK